MKNIKLIIIGLVGLILFGCHVTPYGIYDLRVADKSAETLWLNGKELLKLTNTDAEVIVNYDDTRNGMLMFDVSILNTSKELMLISPEDFYCETINRLDEKSKINALNPEKMINHYSKSIERLDAQKSSAERENLVFSMFDFADNFTDKTDEERDKDRQEQLDREESQERRVRKNRSNRETMAEKRYSFETESLRKTSLMPDQKLTGRVYFVVKGSFKEFTLHIPTANDEFVIKYDIEKL